MIVIEKELGGKLLTAGQLALLGSAAIAACDDVGGVDLGYIPDLDACHYDPTQDQAVLCMADGGTNDTPDCVNPAQANAVNRIWYGQTRDGSVPAPADDHGYGSTLDQQPRAPFVSIHKPPPIRVATRPKRVATNVPILEP